MITLTRRSALALVAPATIALAGCNPVARATTSTGDMNRRDLDFVTNARNIIDFDREECRDAETKAQSPAVRAIAAKLLADANAFDAKLEPVLQQAGITGPSELRSDLRVRLAHMRLQNGLDFDRTFIDDQIATHEEIINREQMMSGRPGMNPRIIQLAQEGAQILERNLAELRRLQRQMMTG